MVEYKCIRCAKIYSNKFDYNRHVNRKNQCGIKLSDELNSDLRNLIESSEESSKNPIVTDSDVNAQLIQVSNKNNCTYCSKQFSTNSNMNKHMKKCPEKNKPDINKEAIFNTLLMKFEEKCKELDNFKEMFFKMNTNPDKTINNIDRQQINTTNIDKQQNIDKQIVNNNVKLIAFGKEDMNCIADNICKQILSKGFQSVPKLIEHVHFNKDKPEYHNVYIPNYRNNFAMIFNGDEWGLSDRDEVVAQLKEEKTEFINAKFNELIKSGELSESTIKKIKRFLSEKDEDPADTNIKNDIKLMLYNKRNIVLNSIKKTKQIQRLEA
jgi:DNA-directed RNA polymerase subunit RPC12/RpoP